MACDFLTVDSVRLGVFYVLVFLEISSRRVIFCNASAHPDSAWVAQLARKVAWELEELKIPIKPADPRPGLEVRDERHLVQVLREL